MKKLLIVLYLTTVLCTGQVLELYYVVFNHYPIRRTIVVLQPSIDTSPEVHEIYGWHYIPIGATIKIYYKGSGIKYEEIIDTDIK